MHAKSRILFAAMAAFALPAASSAADPPAGIKSVLQTCVACHGPKGISPIGKPTACDLDSRGRWPGHEAVFADDDPLAHYACIRALPPPQAGPEV